MKYDEEFFSDLECFIKASRSKKNGVTRFMWLFENESSECRAIGRKHPELNKEIQKIRKIYDSCLVPKFKEINLLMRKVKRYSPKY
jgi:hypothetical protein